MRLWPLAVILKFRKRSSPHRILPIDLRDQVQLNRLRERRVEQDAPAAAHADKDRSK